MRSWLPLLLCAAALPSCLTQAVWRNALADPKVIETVFENSVDAARIAWTDGSPPDLGVELERDDLPSDWPHDPASPASRQWLWFEGDATITYLLSHREEFAPVEAGIAVPANAAHPDSKHDCPLLLRGVLASEAFGPPLLEAAIVEHFPVLHDDGWREAMVPFDAIAGKPWHCIIDREAGARSPTASLFVFDDSGPRPDLTPSLCGSASDDPTRATLPELEHVLCLLLVRSDERLDSYRVFSAQTLMVANCLQLDVSADPITWQIRSAGRFAGHGPPATIAGETTIDLSMRFAERRVESRSGLLRVLGAIVLTPLALSADMITLGLAATIADWFDGSVEYVPNENGDLTIEFRPRRGC